MWRWICLVLAVSALTAVSRPAVGQAQERPSIQDVLMAAALTEANMPRGLALDRGRTGLQTTEEGGPSYMATFVADGTGDRPIMGVVNIVGQYADAATGIDRHADRFRAGLAGNRTELPAPAVGEASRAFTVTSRVMGGALAASTAFIAIRRADMVASVAVASLGDTPEIDVALRLAQDVDRRLTAALSPGG